MVDNKHAKLHDGIIVFASVEKVLIWVAVLTQWVNREGKNPSELIAVPKGPKLELFLLIVLSESQYKLASGNEGGEQQIQ